MRHRCRRCDSKGTLANSHQLPLDWMPWYVWLSPPSQAQPRSTQDTELVSAIAVVTHNWQLPLPRSSASARHLRFQTPPTSQPCQRNHTACNLPLPSPSP